jgi:zinc transport system substrate-binding protein
MRLLSIGLAVAGLLVLTGCPTSKNNPWGETTKPKVLVSFPGLYSFAAAVAGDDAIVKSFTTGQGVHFHGDFSKRDLDLCRHCDVFVANGLGLDDKTAKKLQQAAKGNWTILNASEKIDKSMLYEGACSHNHNDGEDAAGHDHDHPIDPHSWLGIPQAKVMVAAIRDDLKARDPAHAEGYERRAAAYTAKLDALQAEGIALLKDKKERKIITFHDSLQYFTKNFDLRVGAVIELSEGVEPNPAQLKDLIRRCQLMDIRVIAVEPQFPRNTSASVIKNALLGQKVEAEYVEIDPIETSDERDLSVDLYETKFRENLANLAKVLR